MGKHLGETQYLWERGLASHSGSARPRFRILIARIRSAEGHYIRRARPADRKAVQRELAAYFAFLGEALDPAGLDHDVAEWEQEYSGDTGVFLLVVDGAGRSSGPPGSGVSN